MTSERAAPIVQTHGLTRRFGSLAAVDNLGNDGDSDEIFGLLGSNGAGKSTLIKMLMMPLFFASSALYPFPTISTWLQVISHVNSLTYQVDAMRTLMLQGQTSAFGMPTDFAVLGVASIAMVILTGRIYAGIIT